MRKLNEQNYEKYEIRKNYLIKLLFNREKAS